MRNLIGVSPAWVSAIATCGLFVAAVVAAAVSWRVFLQDRNERQQAAKIAAWTATKTGVDGQTFGLCLQNSSQLPITQIEVWTSHRSAKEPLGPQKYEALAPGFYFASSASHDVDRSTNKREGHGSFRRPTLARIDDPSIWPTMVKPDSAQVTKIRFTDAAGAQWERSWGKKLRRLRATSRSECDAEPDVHP